MKFLNFTNSVTNFFLVLLLVTLGSIFFFTPSKYSEDRFNGELPKIELSEFNMYQINTGFVDMKIEGSGALQFDDYEILFGFLASRYNAHSKKMYEYISGEQVIKTGDIYNFPQGVVYTKSDGGSFWSEDGVYDYRKEIFKGKGDFILSTLEGDFEGKNIIYNRKSQNIRAIDIASKIFLGTEKDNHKKREK